MTVEVNATVRDRCKRDLWYLAKFVLEAGMFEEGKLVERVHKPVCDFFVHKNPDLPLGKQSPRKNRALFDPRGHLKTTLDIADMVQWSLDFPNIKILLMSGNKDMAVRIVDEWSEHFEKNQIMREIFPEYCSGLLKTEKGYGRILPNRTQFWREPTIVVASADSVKAGGHYHLRIGDDVVNETNSKNAVQVKETTQDWKKTRPLAPGGYTTFVDTRYDYSDAGGDIIEGNPPVKGQVKDLDGFGYMWSGKDWDIFIRACWKFDEHGRKTLLFPEAHCTDDTLDTEKENLDAIQREDPGIFSCQYLNNPSPTGSQSFEKALIARQTVSRSMIPATSVPFMAWYLGFNEDDPSDPAVGIVGAFSPDGSLYIIDCFRGIWSTGKIIDATMVGHRHWSLRRIGFAAKKGELLVGPGLDARMRENRIYMPIEYIPLPDNRAMQQHMVESLPPLLGKLRTPTEAEVPGKLFFSNDMPHYDQMMLEFTRFPKYRYMGIPLAIATLAVHYRSAYQRMMSQVASPEPVGEVYGAQHHGMFDDMDGGGGEDCQELSAGIVG